MKNVLTHLREYTFGTSGVEKKLVDYLLLNPQEAANDSIIHLACQTGCSPATVTRLCKKIGLSGYRELQRMLIQNLSMESDKKIELEIGHTDSIEQLINKVTKINIESLENTRRLLDSKALMQCVELIETSETLYLFGMGSSLLVAHDAYLKFLRINKSCVISDDWHAQLLQAYNIHKGDLAIVISYSGRTKEMLDCVKEIKRRGAPVVAITRFDNSPLSRLSEINLYVASSELLVRTGATASRISQLNVIDLIYSAYIHRNYKKCIEQISRTSIHKVSQKGE